MPSASPGFGYGAAVDAGSSGSRIYLYRWPRRGDPSSFARVERRALFGAERTPGIDDARGLGIVRLAELVRLAEAALPPGVDAGTVPIHLGATAGMRIADAARESEVLADVRAVLRASGFAFRDDWARTISGEEEGAYDWLVANYLKNDGRFPTSSTTYGTLDLGGASTQISFPVPTSAEDKLPLRIDDVEYPLYTQSFLHYGVDRARARYDADVASATGINPCYPAGYADADAGVSGSSDWEGCLRSVEAFFDRAAGCDGGGKGRCLIGEAHRPLHDNQQRFIAMSAFVYTWDYLSLRIGERTDDLTTLDARARRICNLNQQRQLARYERQIENRPSSWNTTKPFAQCFNAAFSYHLLSRGYGMPATGTPIEIYHDIGGTRVQWALGLMLVEANRLGYMFREGGQPRQLDIVGVVNTCGYLFIISTAVLVTLKWVVGKRKTLRTLHTLLCRRKHEEQRDRNEIKHKNSMEIV